jgi:hypothetical protein
MRELLRTTDPTEIAFATALLSGEDIEVFAFDVHTSALIGGFCAVPCRLMVREADFFLARTVLADNGLPVP